MITNIQSYSAASLSPLASPIAPATGPAMPTPASDTAPVAIPDVQMIVDTVEYAMSDNREYILEHRVNAIAGALQGGRSAADVSAIVLMAENELSDFRQYEPTDRARVIAAALRGPYTPVEATQLIRAIEISMPNHRDYDAPMRVEVMCAALVRTPVADTPGGTPATPSVPG